MRKLLVLSMLLIAMLPCYGRKTASKKSPTEALRDRLDTFAIVKRFMYAAYPQLKESYQLQRIDYFAYKLSPTAPRGAEFTVDSFCKAPIPPNVRSYQVRGPQPCHVFYPARQPLMLGNFVFAPSGALEQYEGVFTEQEKKLQEVIAGVNYLPADSSHEIPKELRPGDKEIIQRLISVGAQYTPDKKDAFLQLLKEQHLDQFFGASRIKSVDFVSWNDSHAEPILQWLVQMEVLRTHKTYLLFYNSFDGSLRNILPQHDLKHFDLKAPQPTD